MYSFIVCARARQVVLGGAPLPPEVARYSLVHIVGWDARGAELTHNRYFDGFNGIRWKSSYGVIKGCDLRDIKYLEVTPLQHYLEGTLQIQNVSVVDNVLEESKVSFCRGTNGRGEFWNGTCSGMVLRNNSDW